jgi:hypothetical protein
MARRTIHFSDLSSQPILDEADVVRIVVIDHPVLGGDAVEFEAAVSELADIDKGALDVVVIEVHPAGGEPSRRVVLDQATFDKLAVDQPMEELLRSATPSRPNGRAERMPAGRVNYATVEHAGSPHKGKVTEAEARLVRENLDVINARLAAAGQRTIDPAVAAMRERYGFEVTADQAHGVADPEDAATPGAETGPSGQGTEPEVTPTAQRGSAARSAAGQRRSAASSTGAAPAATAT